MENFQKIKTGSCPYIIMLLILCVLSNTVWAKRNNPPPKVTRSISIDKAAQLLLDASKWEAVYDKERKRDVKYLLGTIDGKVFEGLNEEQKQQVRLLMQAKAMDQMEKDRAYFKKYLIGQYAQFFTIDEIETLTKYFNTELIQTGVSAKLENDNLTKGEIKDKLIHAKEKDKKSIESFSGSYLYTRYFRFQDKIKPLLDKMIVDRLKTVLDNVIAVIPELVEYNKNYPLDIKNYSGQKK